ncbi:MAG: hypothetical protein ACREEM_48325, partial [Blastocatellia bacterium]
EWRAKQNQPSGSCAQPSLPRLRGDTATFPALKRRATLKSRSAAVENHFRLSIFPIFKNPLKSERNVSIKESYFQSSP